MALIFGNSKSVLLCDQIVIKAMLISVQDVSTMQERGPTYSLYWYSFLLPVCAEHTYHYVQGPISLQACHWCNEMLTVVWLLISAHPTTACCCNMLARWHRTRPRTRPTLSIPHWLQSVMAYWNMCRFSNYPHANRGYGLVCILVCLSEKNINCHCA